MNTRRLLLPLLTVCLMGGQPVDHKRDYRAAMREFVQAISVAAKKTNPAFLVVPQGGLHLLTDKGKRSEAYLKAIDGVGQEEIFYGYDNKNNRKTPKKETDFFLKQLAVAKAAGKPVLSIDYANKKPLIDDAYARNKAAGFIPFVADRRGLDNIPKYPARPVNEHDGDIKTLKDVKNFLYLIDPGKFGSKAKYLAALAKTNYDLLVIDVFTGDWTVTPEEELKPLKRKPNGGRRLVLCYVSIGEAENYRFYWKKGWKPGKPAFLEKENPQWKGNFAVRYWEAAWQALFVGEGSYLSRVLAAGFDGVYLDKVDEYEWFEEHGE